MVFWGLALIAKIIGHSYSGHPVSKFKIHALQIKFLFKLFKKVLMDCYLLLTLHSLQSSLRPKSVLPTSDSILCLNVKIQKVKNMYVLV